MDALRVGASLLLACLLTPLARADAQVTIVTPEKTVTVEGASVDAGELWIPAGELKGVTGFELKPEGVCKEEVCVPLPAKPARWVRGTTVGRQSFNLSAFATKMGRPVVANGTQTVFSLGAPAAQGRGLRSGRAPDFALQDVNGKTVRLKDFRGKKVLLWVWASW